MKIYTKTGDQGETSLVYGQRVAKDSARVEAYGTCDEANSMIGLAISLLPETSDWTQFETFFQTVQTKLFHVGSELSTPSGKQVAWVVTIEDVQLLEAQIDQMDAELSPLTKFILPGGHRAAATLHLARTIVRRAERNAVTISHLEAVSEYALMYLNRLSDCLFVAARYVNQRTGTNEPTLHQ